MSKQSDQLMQSFTYLSFSSSTPHNAWTPNTDVYEHGENLVVRLELAGVAKEDLEISLTDRLLVVRGERKDPCRRGGCSFRQVEIDYGSFERRIIAPWPVDGRRARAEFKSGFLHIELPKAPRAVAGSTTLVIRQIV